MSLASVPLKEEEVLLSLPVLLLLLYRCCLRSSVQVDSVLSVRMLLSPSDVALQSLPVIHTLSLARDSTGQQGLSALEAKVDSMMLLLRRSHSDEFVWMQHILQIGVDLNPASYALFVPNDISALYPYGHWIASSEAIEPYVASVRLFSRLLSRYISALALFLSLCFHCARM